MNNETTGVKIGGYRVSLNWTNIIATGGTVLAGLGVAIVLFLVGKYGGRATGATHCSDTVFGCPVGNFLLGFGLAAMGLMGITLAAALGYGIVHTLFDIEKVGGGES